jgi:putative aldouronate transport system substrate-binding protein
MKMVVVRGLMMLLSVFILFSCDARDSAEQIDERQRVSWWCTNRAQEFGLEMDALPVFQRIQEETGVHIDFVHPPPGQYGIRFQLMLRTRRFPDILSHDFAGDYPGGTAGAIEDGVVSSISVDALATSAPHVSAFLTNHPEIAGQLRTDDGGYLCVPSVNLDDGIRSYVGPFLRADLLADLRLDAPETLDDWERVLAAFAETPDIDVPMTFYGGSFRSTQFLIGSYGIGWGFFRRDGSIVYGPLEPEFPDALKRLRDWFQAGWIDARVVFNSRSAYQRSIARTSAGAYVDYISNIAAFEEILRERDPDARLTPVVYPRLDDGGTPVLKHRSPAIVPFAGAYLSTRNDDIPASLAVLDFGYSEAGTLLYNFGIEGESYEVVGGLPRFFDGGRTVGRYVVAGPYVRSAESFRQMLHLESQRDAARLWSSAASAAAELPAFIGSAADRQFLAQISGALDEYLEGMLIEYVTGGHDDSFVDDLVVSLREMGAEAALAIYNDSGARSQ